MKNEIPKIDVSNSETGCCPKFNPEPWDEKVFEFDKLLFAKAETKSFYYMPLNMSSVMTRAMNAIKEADAEELDKYLILSRDLTPWKAEHYFLVTKEVPGLENIKLTGTFMTKVYEGSFKEIPNWIKDMEKYVKKQGKEMKKIYYFYTTCPKCAKYYGKNYVVLFAEV